MIPGKRTLVPAVGLIVVVASCLALVIYIRHAPTFEITHIGIRGNVQSNPEDLVKHLNIHPHTNIFQIPLDEIQARLESLQWVKTATVFRTIPNKLRIDLTEREPFALVKLDQLHIVDNEGVVLGALASGSAIRLPIVTGKIIESMRVDDQNLQVRPVFQALDRLMRTSPPVLKDVRKIVIHSLENATITSYDPLYPEMRVSLQDDDISASNFERFQRMLSTLRLESAAYVDLRFDRRIIVMPQNKS